MAMAMLAALCLAMASASASASVSSRNHAVAFSHVGRGSAEAVDELLRRVLSPGSHPFELEIVEACTRAAPAAARSKLCFELGPGSAAGKVALSGTSGVELARGAAHYLRTRCNMSFAWPRTGGNQVASPAEWPAVEAAETRYRTVEYSYFQNVVESSYSFAFYSWDDWQKLIDWQALSGINLGLAYTGQEEIYRKTYASFGVNSSRCGITPCFAYFFVCERFFYGIATVCHDRLGTYAYSQRIGIDFKRSGVFSLSFANWTNGPAWLSWSRGQSMHGVGAGGEGSLGDGIALSQSWMTAQWQLQKQILARMRALGIVPILPAFQGNVPPIMAFGARNTAPFLNSCPEPVLANDRL